MFGKVRGNLVDSVELVVRSVLDIGEDVRNACKSRNSVPQSPSQPVPFLFYQYQSFY